MAFVKVSSRVAGDSRSTRGSAGAGSFKVYSEDEKVKFDKNNAKPLRESLIPARKSVPVSKRATMTTTSDFKGKPKFVEKCQGKCDNSGSLNVQRKALADLSNVKGNSARNWPLDGSKLSNCRNKRTVILQRFSVGPGFGSVKVSSRKSSTGKNNENQSECVGNAHTNNRGLKGIHVFSKDQSTKRVNSSLESKTTQCRTAKKSLIPIRKSLSAPKKIAHAESSTLKVNVTSLREVKKNSGDPVNTRVGKKILPPVSNSRNYLRRSRASDGFTMRAPRVQTSVDRRPLLTKSIKPTIKLSVTVHNAHKTLKLKRSSDVGKSLSIASFSTKKKEESTKLYTSENATQGSSSETSSSDIICKRKSDRRRSYTSLLVTRSKLPEGHDQLIKQEKLPSIDDDCNQLEVAEYVDEIYQYYWVTEAMYPSLENYMSSQTDITYRMRGILINWLIEVHFKFDLMQETLYLTITLLDRYLSQVQIKKNDLQLVGLTALLLASKYEDFWHPRIKDLISISAESYTRDQVLAMEKLFLKTLKFRLNMPTPYVFMLRFLKAAQSNSKLEHLAFYLMELCLLESEALKFKYSLLCASSIYVARCTLHITPSWTPLLVKHARYDVPQMRDCAEMILKFQRAAKTGQLKVVYEKYINPDRSSVAAIRSMRSLPL